MLKLNVFLTFFQNPLFYILSDDPDWAQANLENVTQDIFFSGSQKQIPETSQISFNSTDEIGKKTSNIYYIRLNLIVDKISECTQIGFAIR